MRFEILVLFLFVGLCCAYEKGEQGKGWKEGDSRDDERRRMDNEWREEDERRREEDERRYNERYGDDNRDDYDDYDWNRDDDRDNGNRRENNRGDGNRNRTRENRNRRNRYDLYYPCDFEDDIDCVRHYFASSGQCKEAHNYARKPVYRNRLVVYLPGFNLTIVVTKSRIKYMRERISRFYIDKKTQRLVMAVDFEGINVDSRYTYFIYQRRGREPIKRADFTNGTYPVTLTAVIPLKDKIDFKDSRVTAYLPVAYPPEIGPRVLNSTDPTVMMVNTAIFADLPKALLEIFLTEAPSLYFGYLQKYICDFGIPINS